MEYLIDLTFSIYRFSKGRVLIKLRLMDCLALSFTNIKLLAKRIS